MYSNTQHGQGLLEAIIATAIIAGGISGVIALAGNQLRASNITSQQIVAVNLAREGVEVVRNMRDSNWLAFPDTAGGWKTGLEGPGSDKDGILLYSTSTHTWSVDFIPDAASEDATALYYDSDPSSDTYGMYFQGVVQGLQPTGYRRLVTLHEICSNDLDDYITSGSCGTVAGFRVYVEVQWDDQAGTNNYTLEQRIYNWR